MAEQLTPLQLVEVLREDRRRRWQNGDRILAEAYLQRHPALHTEPDCALELIYHEVLLREELGEAPRLEEYLQRFPQFASDLAPLFEVHQAIEGGGLVDLHATTPTEHETLLELPPPLIPGYEVLNLLGRGGMGVVYRARHERLNRIVALKMIRAGAQASPEELARFRTEAAVQAQLQHPHIVQIFEVGEAAGGPYFALEFIDGLSLDKQTAGKPQPARAAAELVQTLARAVHHAHEKALVHRDLKPGNILVTADGTPKVGDFGLAKRLEGEAGQTQSGAVVGTANYMAPEQAWGRVREVGPAADIHALGAILYELLTGRPPFLGATTLDTVLQVRHQEPVPPRRWLANVPRDLETICLKCLRKEPVQRYDSALALADDLQRFLNGEPIQARPVGTVERGVKWARRRPAAAALAGVAVLVLVGGAAGGLWFAERERSRADLEGGLRREAVENENKAKAQEAQAQEEKEKAKRAEAEAQAVLRFFHDKVLLAARPEGMKGALGKDTTLRAVLDAAEPEIEKAFAAQPVVEAKIRNTLATSYGHLGEPFLAIRLHKQAVTLLRQSLGLDDPETLASMNNLAGAHLAVGQLVEAVALFEEILQRQKTLFHPDHVDTLTVMNNLASAYRRVGRLADALPLFEEALTRRQASLGPSHPATLTSMNNLAGAYLEARRAADALPLYEEALKGHLARLGPSHPDTLQTRNNLATAYASAGRLTDALPLFEEVLESKKAKLGLNHPSTLRTRHNLAGMYRDTNQLAKSLPLFEDTLKAYQAKLGPDHPDTLVCVDSLARTYQQAGRLADALPLFDEALRGREARLGVHHPDTLTSMINLAAAYLAAKQPEKAIPLFHDFLAAQRRRLPADDPRLAVSLVAVGRDLLKHGQYTEAEKVLRESLTIREAKLPDDWSTFNTRSMLGGSLLGQQKYTEAEPLLLAGYEGTQARARSIPPQGKIRLTEALDRLVQLYEAWGKKDQAEQWRKRRQAESAQKPKPD